MNHERILIDIDEAFGEIKRKQDIEENLRSIKMSLGKLGIKVKQITIVPADNDEFFGMSIYPNHGVADRIVQCMIDKKPLKAYEVIWSNIDEWIIEIDSKIIYNPQLNSNPAELTAALLHEIGHTIYSNTIPQKLHKTMSYTFLNLPSDVRIILTNGNKTFKALFTPIVAQASRNISYSLKKEIEADKYVVKMGYGQSLETLLQKILMTFGSSFVDTTDREIEQNLKVTANWSRSHSSELRLRKDYLRDSINSICLITPSLYIREIFEDINVKVFKGSPSFNQVISRENRGKYLTESVLPNDLQGIPCNAVIESARNTKFDKYGKLQKVTQHDVDIVAIQIDKIENQNDKIYLLDVIYDYNETLDLAEECLHDGRKSAVQMSERQIKDIREQLADLRKRVMTTKITEKQYGIFIKYPVGYEG